MNDGVAAVGEAEVEPGIWEQLCADCLVLVDDTMPVRWWPQHNATTRRTFYTDGGD